MTAPTARSPFVLELVDGGRHYVHGLNAREVRRRITDARRSGRRDVWLGASNGQLPLQRIVTTATRRDHA